MIRKTVNYSITWFKFRIKGNQRKEKHY